MRVLETAVHPGGEEFEAHQAANLELVKDLREQIERIAGGGGERSRERHVAGKNCSPEIASTA